MATPTVTDPLVAQAVINEATAQGIHKEGMPADSSAQIILAQELVRLAEQAIAAGMAGPSAPAVIAAASQQPVVAAAPVAAAPVAAAPPLPTPPQVTNFNVVIQDAAGQKYEVPSDQVEQYVANGYSVVEDTPAPPPVPAPVPVAAPAPVAPEPVAAAEPTPAPAASGTPEPYEGFNAAKIPEIVEYIENVLATQGEAVKPLLAAIWEYEAANKNRPRLLGKLKAIAERGVEVTPAAAPAAPPAPAPVAAEPQPGVNPDPPFVAPPAPPVAAPVAAVAPPVAAPIVPAVPTAAQPEFGQLAPALPGATQAASATVTAEGLPIPPVVGEPPVLPPDFTVLSDLDVRKYQSQFNACQARALYLHTIAEGHANDAKLVADAAQRDYIHSNAFAKGTTVTQIEAEAVANVPAIQEARRVQHDWTGLASQYKTLATIYDKTCDRLLNERVGRHAEQVTS